MIAEPTTLHGLLQAAAERRPDAIAIRSEGEEITYADLQRLAAGIATTLITAGVRVGDRVGIHRLKSVETIAALYGVMMAGAAYVPLDPHAPAHRSSQIADNCLIKVLITQGERGAAVIAGMTEPPSLVIATDEYEIDGAIPWSRASVGTAEVLPTTGADSLAYVLYTSGSTGTPKGVMLTHGNAVAFVSWARDRIGVAETDRLSNHAPLHFDLSIFDVYVAAAAGATLIIVPETASSLGPDLVAFVQREQITVWYSVPSALILMTRASDDPASFASLRTVVFAGEVYPIPQLHDLRAVVPQAALWNLYGPTETNVCTYLEVTEIGDTPLPIGRACENGTLVFALCEDGTAAEVGQDGELFVAGPTVMRGYWGMPERDAEVLVPDPRGGRAVWYRTGDIVTLRPDGGYDFKGRRDHQIKSRGYRIELGEIEAALHDHPDVVDAVAVALPHKEWGTAVIGVVVLRPASASRPVDLQRHVSQRLPRYMVPARIDVLEALPLTRNGKADRQRIAAVAAESPLPGGRPRPSSGT